MKLILSSMDGLSIESEGTLYVRSLGGGAIAAGFLDDEGTISEEHDFGEDVAAAIDFFWEKRIELNHE